MVVKSQDAGATVASMWFLVAIIIVFVALRLYTRLCVVKQAGADDVAYTIAGILQLLYTVFIQLARNHGYGYPTSELDVAEVAQAVKWEMIGQTFAVFGITMAKISLGLMLLRFSMKRWHKIVIWVSMGLLLSASILVDISFWIQCRPVQAIYDPRLRPNAVCDVDETPFATTLTVTCVTADFFFAIFPAVVIWPLNMKKKEKITLIASLGLGVFAGVAGIIRTFEVITAFDPVNYTESSVGLIIWSAAEVAITMVCIGIPVLRPLYTKVIHGYYGSSKDRSYPQRSGQRDGTWELKEGTNQGFGGKGGGIYKQTDIAIQTDNQSDEHILSPDEIAQSRIVTDPRAAGSEWRVHHAGSH